MRSETLTDNEIMLMVRNGDLDKMTLLFERHHRSLFGFFYHMTGKKDFSEDLIQTVFYRMLKYRNSFQGSGEFKKWMYFLSFNVLKDEMKKNKRKYAEKSLSEFEDQVEYGELAGDAIEKEQDLSLLRNAIGKLSPDERRILILSKFQQLRYNEISEILGISEGAVKVRVHRAFTQLKNIYLKTASYAL